MSDVAREIVEFVKLKDRPSLFELRAFKYPRSGLRITAPVKDGRHVWVVERKDDFNKEDNKWQFIYPVENLQGVAALLEGQVFCKETDGLCIEMRGSVGKGYKGIEARWDIEPEDADTYQKRIDIINGALKAFLME